MQPATELQLIRRSRLLTSMLLAVCACIVLKVAGTRATAAQDNIFARVCAEQEVKAITSLEDHGAAKDVPDDQLSAAAFTMLEARLTCYAGKVDEALALYQRVIDLKSHVAKKQ